MTFKGRPVVVTGGTGALGSAVVARLIEADAQCHVTYIKPEELDHFESRDDERVTLHQLDLTSEEAVTGRFEQIDQLAASIHLAGGFAMSSIEGTSAADFRAMMELNAVTCLLACREAIKAMRRSRKLHERDGGGTLADEADAVGRIVNVSARPAVQPVGGMVAYSASKAAVASITQSLAHETRGEGILINAVLPSIIDSPANRKAMPDADFTAWPKPAQIAETIAFLAGPQNLLTSGALVPVFGRS